MPELNETGWLTIVIGITAALYAAVGQAGASGYLAAMGLFGLEPSVMKPTALALNVLVVAIGTIQFWKAGLLSWRDFYPFGVLGFLFSLVGGALNLPATVYFPVVGAVLLVAAVQLVRSANGAAESHEQTLRHPPFVPALAVGAGIGFFSGLTGTGGGIFLAPVILMMSWVEPRRAAAVTAAYNLMNSAAALAGSYASLSALPPTLPWWLAAAGIGGLVGALLRTRYLPDRALRYILAGVLAISGGKLLLM